MRFFKNKVSISVSCLALLFSNQAFSTEYDVTTDVDNASGSLRDIIENIVSDGDSIYLGDVQSTSVSSPIYIKDKNITVKGDVAKGEQVQTSVDTLNSLGQSYILENNWSAFNKNGDFNDQIESQINASLFDNMTSILVTGNGAFISNDAIGNSFNLNNIAFTSSNATVSGSSALFINAGLTDRSNPSLLINVGELNNSYVANNNVTVTNSLVGGGLIGSNTQVSGTTDYLTGATSQINALNNVIFNNNKMTMDASLFGGGLIGAFSGSFLEGSSPPGGNCSGGICIGGNIGANGGEYSFVDIKGVNNSIFNGNDIFFSEVNSKVYLWGGGLVGGVINNGIAPGQKTSSITIGNIENSIFSNNSINSASDGLQIYGGGLIGATTVNLESPITLGNLSNNIFSSNSVNSYQLYGGGLVGLSGQASDVSPETSISDIDNNLFIGNTITSGFIQGGGLIGVSSSFSTIGNISNSYFYDNTIDARGSGGTMGAIDGGALIGLVSHGSSFSPSVFGDITNSYFINNTVSLSNGVNAYVTNFGLIGAFNQYTGPNNRPVYFGDITNSIFQGNSITSTLGAIKGGLIFSSGLGETMNIQNSQFINNTLSAPQGVSGTIVIDLTAKPKANTADSTTAHIKLTANDNEQTAFYKNGDSAKGRYNSIYFAQLNTSGTVGEADSEPQQDAAITVDSNGTGIVSILDPIEVDFVDNTTGKDFSFSKIGDGLLLLSGNNRITGFITDGSAQWNVDNGEMLLVKTDTSGDASITMEKDGNTSFTLANEGVIRGSGSITANDITIAGTLAPSLYETTDGNTVLTSKYGQLDFLNSITLNSATYDVDVAKTESDYIYVDGDINATDSYINVTSAIYENASVGHYDGYEKTIMEASGTISGGYKVTIDSQALNPVDYLQGIGGRIEDNNKYILNVGFLSWKSTAFDRESDKLLAHGNFTLKNPEDTFVLTESLADRTDIDASNTLSGWDGTTLNKKGNGTLVLDGANTYTGLTTVEAGTLIVGDNQSPLAKVTGDIVVDSGAILSGAGTVVGQVDNQGYIASYNALSSQINTNVSNFTVGELSNSGIIQLAGGMVGNTLTVEGDYFGNNGALFLNTVLDDSDSLTDKLIIKGAASGNTSVFVTNRDGLGALTTGNGIEVIEVGGLSPDDAFALSSDYQYQGKNAVVGGAYAYSLYHNGVDADINDGNWYLRSLKITDISDNPVYQPGAPLYESYPQALLQINQLGTLIQRVGNRTWLNPIENGIDTVDEVDGRGFWMKVEGSTGHVNPKKSTTDSDYDINIIKTQLGIDFNAFENEYGALIGGMYFQYGHAKTDVSSRFGKGDIKTNGYGLGGTLTWYGNNNIYIDGVAQAMWYKSDIKSDTLHTHEIDGNKGTGYALSIETGKKLILTPEITLTPQIQLSYNSIDFDSFRDAYQAKVSNQEGDALTGRLGVALERETMWTSESGDIRRLNAYGIANLYYEFLGETEVAVTGVKFESRPDPVWAGLGAGLSHSWNDEKYSIYGELTTRSSLADFGNSYSLNGTVGFRARF